MRSLHQSPETAPGADRMELISFQVREQSFCLDLMVIRELRVWSAPTPLPQAPDFVRGVVNLRGTVLPIIDLGARLGLGATEATHHSAILVAEAGDRLVGLLVDSVSEILSVSVSSIQPTPDVGCRATREFIRGLLAADGQMIALLKLDCLVPALEAVALAA